MTNEVDNKIIDMEIIASVTEFFLSKVNFTEWKLCLFVQKKSAGEARAKGMTKQNVNVITQEISGISIITLLHT